MSEQNPDSNRKEIKRTVRLLNGIKNLASEASLTGSLGHASGQAALQYNSILKRLEMLGEVPTGFFLQLENGVNFDEVGFAAAQLATYLYEEEEEESRPVPNHGPTNSPTIIMNGLNGLEGLDKIQDIGKIIREHLPEWMKSKYDLSESRREAPEAPAPPEHPEPPEPPTAPVPQEPTTLHHQTLVEEAHTTNFVPDRAIGAERTATF